MDPVTQERRTMETAYNEYLGTLNAARSLRDNATSSGDHVTALMNAIADETDAVPVLAENSLAPSTMKKRAGAYRAARWRLLAAMTAYDDAQAAIALETEDATAATNEIEFEIDRDADDPIYPDATDHEEHAGHLDGLIAQDQQPEDLWTDGPDEWREAPVPTQADIDAATENLGMVLIGGRYVPVSSIPTTATPPSESQAPLGTSDTEVVWVKLDLLPTDLDAEPNKDLERSMATNGQIHAVRLEELPDGTYRVVAGRRRILAARALKWEAIRAEINLANTIEDADGHWAIKASLAENAVRSDNPIDEYRKIKMLMTAGYSEKDIYGSTGMPIMTIRRRLILDDLTPALWTRLEKGDMGVWAAEYAAKFPASLQNKLAEETGKLTGKKIDKIRRERQKAAVDALFDEDDEEHNILAGEPEKLPWETVAAQALKTLEGTLESYGEDASGFLGKLLKLRQSLGS